MTPSQTQQVVREIQDQLYTDTPAGLAGNDDLGAMSSWYVWSALGAYPETPGSAEVALGSPLFPAITLDLANGKTITETAPAASHGRALRRRPDPRREPLARRLPARQHLHRGRDAGLDPRLVAHHLGQRPR